jgi:hypothetical protein
MGLSPMSVRFMWLMHRLDRADEDNAVATGGHRGMFCGQVLSLHPVGRWLLYRPEYLEPIGRWLAHPDHERLCLNGAALDCAEYQSAVTAILCAAHEYRMAHDAYESARNAGRGAGGSPRAAARGSDADAASSASSSAPPPIPATLEPDLLDALTAVLRVTCPTCRGPARATDCQRDAADDGRAVVTCACDACRATWKCSLVEAEIRTALLRDAA